MASNTASSKIESEVGDTVQQVMTDIMVPSIMTEQAEGDCA